MWPVPFPETFEMQRIDLVLSLPLYFLLGSCGGHDNENGHDHDRDHEHGTESTEAAEESHESESHAHVHEAPHGGTLVSIADGGANIEVCLDGDAGTLTLYLFDGCAENSLRSDLEIMFVVCDGETFQLAARASELSGETVGDSSEFGLTDERLKGLTALVGTVAQVSLLGSTLTDVPIEYSASHDTK